MPLWSVNLKVPLRLRLERRQVDLAVTLHAVAVAGREQAAVGEDREVDRGRADPEMLIVDVAAERARLDRAALAPLRRRRRRP